jgi:hypothetical protein
LPTLEDQLANWIGDIAEALGRGYPASDPGFDPIRSMKLALCLNPRQAIVTVGPDGPGQTTIVYAADPGPTLAMRRLTILSGELLMAAGELLADSNEQIAAIECMQFLASSQPAKAGAGQKYAGSARTEPASFRDQPRANETDPESSAAEGIRAEKEFQARLVTPNRSESLWPMKISMT